MVVPPSSLIPHPSSLVKYGSAHRTAEWVSVNFLHISQTIPHPKPRSDYILEKFSAKIFLIYNFSGLEQDFHGRPFLLFETVQKSDAHPGRV